MSARVFALSRQLTLFACAVFSATGVAATGSHVSGRVGCAGGSADVFSCSRIDLLSHLSSADLGGGRLSDIWGWVDPDTGREYVIVGRFAGTTFVDVTNPEAPLIKGTLPAHEEPDSVRCAVKLNGFPAGTDEDDGQCIHEGSTWRDMKVYSDHVFVVSESDGHGMQVFDLKRLRSSSDSSQFDEDAHYRAFGNAHNIVINEATGFAYAVGTTTFQGGLHFVDVRDPTNPVAAGGFGGDGYTHDAQCVIYAGPDSSHQGREVCFASNEETVTIVDVTDKAAPSLISRTGYPDAQYVHQGWLSDDHSYFYQNDELDERGIVSRTRTQVWDVRDLDNPRVATGYLGLISSIDHNNYVLGKYLFQSNYTSGLRVLDISHPTSPLEIAHFDSFVDNDNVVFDGTWSNYPFLPSGTVAVSDISEGLFLLRPMFNDPSLVATDISVTVGSAVELGSGSAGRGSFGYVTTVENVGSQTAEDVRVTLVFEFGTQVTNVDANGVCRVRGSFMDCDLNTLLAGATTAVRVDLSVPTLSSARFEAHGSALNPDANTANNKNAGSIVLSVTAPTGGSSGGGGPLGPLVMLAMALLWVSRRPNRSASATYGSIYTIVICGHTP